jgi:hypothetical protein
MPAHIGTSFVETILFDGDTQHKASAEAIGSGTLMAVEPGKGIGGWPPQLRALITDSNARPIVRLIHALPVDHGWERDPGVTRRSETTSASSATMPLGAW